MKPFLPALALAPLLLAACVQEVAEVPAAPPPAAGEDTCGAARFAGLVGQTGATISVPAETPYRVFKTGDPLTMDFNPTRLNFEHDKTGKLIRVTCG